MQRTSEGFARWSLRLLADKVVEFGYIENISHETIRLILKKRNQTLAKEIEVIPQEQNSSFVANMEIVLDVYKCPFDPLNPVVCMDESPKQRLRHYGIDLSLCTSQNMGAG